jgi:anaerobic dimethyl sulfoxide reductase subunit B (iron-sulfur subunit)
MGFYFDMTACIGCKTCQIACRDRNSLYDAGEVFRRVDTYETGSYPATRCYTLSDSCNHCAMPACLAVCPEGAISKDGETGVVLIDEEACIGCKSCISACPYGEPVFRESLGKVYKCDSCLSLRMKDELPSCVQACPQRALDFGDLEALQTAYGSGSGSGGLVSESPKLPSADQTVPSLLIRESDAVG